MNKRVAPQNDRTHDPLAMQKVVGSSPIIRFFFSFFSFFPFSFKRADAVRVPGVGRLLDDDPLLCAIARDGTAGDVGAEPCCSGRSPRRAHPLPWGELEPQALRRTPRLISM